MIFAFAAQIFLSRLALTSPRRAELALDDSWLRLITTTAHLLLGGLAAVTLRLIRNRSERP